MDRPETARKTAQDARKARLAKALKANIKRRKAAENKAEPGEQDGEQD